MAVWASQAAAGLTDKAEPDFRMVKSPYLRYGADMAASFEWNPTKDVENQCKHGISFTEAQLAFIDPQRIVARDASHSQTETRYYCFGKVATGILTVRFTYRDGVIRIIGAGFWRRGKKIYEARKI